MSFFVRTGNGGTDPNFELRDLGGVIIASGTPWTELTAYNGSGFSAGQFSPEELSSSESLFNAVVDGYLEASTTGITNNIVPTEYAPAVPLSEIILNSNGGVNLADSRLVLPVMTAPLMSGPSPRTGEVFFDSDDGYISFFDGYVWTATAKTDGGIYTGVHDFGEASGLEFPNNTILPSSGAPAGSVFALNDGGTMKFFISDGTNWDQITASGGGDSGFWFESGNVVQLINDGYVLRVDEAQFGNDSSVEITRDGYGNLTFKDQAITNPITLSEVIEGEIMFNKEVDELSDGDTIYIGESQPGTATSAALWRIRRITFTDVDGDDVSIKWADGDALFNNVWDNRLSLSYS